MDLKTVKTLEYDKILSKIRSFAVSVCAKEGVTELLPFDAPEDIYTAQDETAEAYKVKYTMGLEPIEEFDDCEEIISKSQKGAMLSPAELLKVRRLLRSGRIAQSALFAVDVPRLKTYSDSFFVDRNLEDEIDRCILSENEISDNASTALRDIRRKIAEKKNALKEKLSSYFRKSEYSKFMQDNLVTVRGGRFVLPIKSEYRSAVPGLIHDMSSSGATVFIEPFAVVETNNEIKSLTLAEAAEIERILMALSESVSAISDNLIKTQEAVTKLDIIFAKAKYSAEIRGTQPIFNKKGVVELKNARHPLIDKDKVVPINISLGERKILMITGPNTGGKTVSLKTVGLTCLMAYSGLFIPCDAGSSVALFSDVFCDIGDEQSIAESLSTFSSHLTNLIRITNVLTANTLVLFDELGGGTDPQEGAALAIGMIKFIEQVGACAIITTHYGELKEYALASDKILSAGMQFDSVSYKPTYRLMVGVPGTSNAINIARSLGLNETILKFAEGSMSEEKVRLEKLIASAEAMKSASEEELRKTEELKSELLARRDSLARAQDELNSKLEKLNFNAKAEIKRLVSAGVERAEELIEEIKQKVKIADEKSLLEAKAIKKQLENLSYEFDEPQSTAYEELDLTKLAVGDRVFVVNLGSVGVIKELSPKKKEALVALGAIKTNVPYNQLKKPIEKEKTKPKRVMEYNPQPKTSDFALIPEVNVIGYTVSEAIEIVEPHLISLHSGDGVKTLRIVHGKGTGALGRGLQLYLKTSPYVKEFRYGRYGEGERGVTIVELK